MDGFLTGVTALTALGCGVVAGVFFAFSAFVMRALSRLSPARGIAGMQAINDAAIPSAFFVTGLVTAIGCLVLGGWALVVWPEPFAPWLLGGSIAYLAGAVLVTVAVHLPRNDALALVDPEGVEAAARWRGYRPGWTAWNHVRASAALVASACLITALLLA